MTFKNTSTGELVAAWQWDGHDEISLQQMLLNLPYTLEGDTVVLQVGDGDRLEITPGTYIVNGPKVGEFRTLGQEIFEVTYEAVA